MNEEKVLDELSKHSQDKDDIDHLMESSKIGFEEDAELMELRKKFNDLKKDRQKCQKDSTTLENKLKLLQIEEQKVLKYLLTVFINNNRLGKELKKTAKPKMKWMKFEARCKRKKTGLKT